MQPIHIIGGGLAGLALGILLREKGVPTTVTEAGTYPRHRVCGEFISGRGTELLKNILRDHLADCSPRLARSAAFFVGARCLGRRTLPSPALCISRFSLDAALARRFAELGGQLQCSQRAASENDGPGLVFANGRRRESVDGRGWRWFGLKAHFRNVALETDLEMHVNPNAYVGLCRLGNGLTNVCGLFRRRGQDGARVDPVTALCGVEGSTLHLRLRQAQPEQPSFTAVAGLSLTPQCVKEQSIRLGDAWKMIPPISGNGMSIAFESAQVAVGSLEHYAQGSWDWARAVDTVNAMLVDAFRHRLLWASLLHNYLFAVSRHPHVAALSYKTMWRAGFDLTR